MSLGDDIDHWYGLLEKRISAIEDCPSEGSVRSYESKFSSMAHRIAFLEEQRELLQSQQSNQQWTDARLSALEHQMKELMDGKRPKANSVSDAEDKLPRDAVPQYIDAAPQ